jgi:hypothetical protein
MRIFCEKQFRRDFNQAVHCIAEEVALLEMRQRSSPTAMYDTRTLTLINQLFFTVRHAKLVTNRRTSGWFHILLSVTLPESNPPEFTYAERVNSIGSKITDGRRLVTFLRKAAILDHAIEGGFERRDWDFELSTENLKRRFDVAAIPDITLPRFTFADLPRSLLGFADPPHNVDMSLHRSLALSLLTGHLLVDCLEPVPLSGFGPRVMNTFAVFHVIRGEQANYSCVCSFEFKNAVTVGPLYIDDYGDTDIGFQRGVLLKLSDDAVDHEIDRILSHGWSDSLL